MIYVYCVLDFRVVVFWWRAEVPPENAKTRKFKKWCCRWMHAKTRKFENSKSSQKKWMKTTPRAHSVPITSSGIFSEIWLVPSAELHSIEPVAESLQPRPQATRKVPPTVPELCQKQGSLWWAQSWVRHTRYKKKWHMGPHAVCFPVNKKPRSSEGENIDFLLRGDPRRSQPKSFMNELAWIPSMLARRCVGSLWHRVWIRFLAALCAKRWGKETIRFAMWKYVKASLLPGGVRHLKK